MFDLAILQTDSMHRTGGAQWFSEGRYVRSVICDFEWFCPRRANFGRACTYVVHVSDRFYNRRTFARGFSFAGFIPVMSQRSSLFSCWRAIVHLCALFVPSINARQDS
jgi:hypothetical protein